MPELEDFHAPCGCYRHTERDKDGKVLWIDEALCATHLQPLWERPLPDVTRHCIQVWTHERKEGTDH